MRGILLKVCMALTGLFLMAFLLVHWAGNLQLFLPEQLARPSFNTYAHVLTSSVVTKAAGWATYASLVAHAVVSGVLAWRHRSVRKPYGLERPASSSPWYSRSMGWLGVLILVFVVLHMDAFWYRYHWGEVGVDADGHKDLYTVVVATFREPLLVVFYVVSMVALGFHLRHGLAAALGSVGVFSKRIGAAAPRVANVVAWTLAGGFASMPVYIFLVHGGTP